MWPTWPAIPALGKNPAVPRIKRWFPVSHDINADPEVLELTDRFGLAGLKIWLQLLSIGDRNDGEVRGQIEYICQSLLFCFASNSRRYGTKWRLNRCQMVLEWMRNKGWIETKSNLILISNHANYHKTRGPNKVPSEPSEPSEPSYLKKDKKGTQPNGFASFWSLYPKKKSKGDAEKAWKSLKITDALLALIISGLHRARESVDWQKQKGQFIPYPATWLRAKGWEDEGILFCTPIKRQPMLEQQPELSEEQRAQNKLKIKEIADVLTKKMAAS